MLLDTDAQAIAGMAAGTDAGIRLSTLFEETGMSASPVPRTRRSERRPRTRPGAGSTCAENAAVAGLLRRSPDGALADPLAGKRRPVWRSPTQGMDASVNVGLSDPPIGCGAAPHREPSTLKGVAPGPRCRNRFLAVRSEAPPQVPQVLMGAPGSSLPCHCARSES
jgi:hypothetical protein